MDVSRRSLLRAAAAGGAALAAPVHWADMAARAAATPIVPRFSDPLTVPHVVVDHGRPVYLSIKNATHRFHSSLGEAATLAYQATDADGSPVGPASTYLGPTIVVRRGRPTELTAENRITHHPLAGSLDPAIHALTTDAGQARTALHLHGGNTEPESDGGPLETFPLDSSGDPGLDNPFTYSYRNSQEAAGLWYHDHALGITRLNVYAGLAAGYLIRDDNDDGSGTRLPAGDYEIPLIIQDKSFNRDGSQFYDPSPWVPEFFGDTAVVNGTAYPFHDVRRGQYRFRVYNGSNARFYRLSLKEKRSGAMLPFLQIGSDGGLLNKPVTLLKLLLAPGERADVIVDFRGLPTGAVVELQNSAATPFPGSAASSRNGGNQIGKIMQFRVENARGWDGDITTGTKLRAKKIFRLDDVKPDHIRTHSLIELFRQDGEVLMATLNNRTFHSADYRDWDLPGNEPVRRDSLEVWEFANTTMDSHPIHLHLVQFQVLNRQAFDAESYLAANYPVDPRTGRLEVNTGPYPAPSPRDFLTGAHEQPAPNEMGWKDTVQAPPGMVTRIVVPFGSGAVPGEEIASTSVYRGNYVWHCHILEHEDNDMMQRYVID